MTVPIALTPRPGLSSRPSRALPTSSIVCARKEAVYAGTRASANLGRVPLLQSSDIATLLPLPARRRNDQKVRAATGGQLHGLFDIGRLDNLAGDGWQKRLQIFVGRPGKFAVQCLVQPRFPTLETN